MPRRKTSFRFNGLAIGDMVRVKGFPVAGQVTAFHVTRALRFVKVTFRADGVRVSGSVNPNFVQRIDGRSKEAREARG